MNLTPHLEQLHIKGYRLRFLNTSHPDGAFSEVPSGDIRPWQNLHFLYLNAVRCPNDPTTKRSDVLPALPNLRSVEILSDSQNLINHLFTTSDQLGSPYQGDLENPPGMTAQSGIASAGWPQLEVFRCHGPIHTSILRKALEKAATNGSLKVLELAINSERCMFNQERQEVDLKDWAFAASSSVHQVGLYHFNWAQHHSDFDGQPFIDWLKKFPAADTVTVAPGRHKGLLPFLLKLVAHPQIQTVAFNISDLSKPELYEIYEAGKTNRVQLPMLNKTSLYGFDGHEVDTTMEIRPRV